MNKSTETTKTETTTVKALTYKDLLSVFVKNNIKVTDYDQYFKDIQALHIVKDMDNMQVIELAGIKKPLLDNVNMVITQLVTELKDMIDTDKRNKVYNEIKEYLLTTKQYITNNTNNLDSILKNIAKCSAVQQQSYLKLKGYTKWATPLVKRNPNTYELKGFTNNSTVILKTSGASYKIEIYPLFFECGAKLKHFKALTKNEADIVRKEVQKQLASVNANDFDNIIVVQEQIRLSQERAREDKKNESWNKKFNKINEIKY